MGKVGSGKPCWGRERFGPVRSGMARKGFMVGCGRHRSGELRSALVG